MTLAKGCHRSHPHELMSPECELRAEIARLRADDEALRDELSKSLAQHALNAESECGDIEERNNLRDEVGRLRADAEGLAAALRDLRQRFHAAIISTGSDAWAADAACSRADAALEQHGAKP